MSDTKSHPINDEFDDEIIRDEVARVFAEHPHDYIEKLEELGFTWFDDEVDLDFFMPLFLMDTMPCML